MPADCQNLEAFAVDNGGSTLVILLLADPLLLEGRQRVFMLWRGDNLDKRDHNKHITIYPSNQKEKDKTDLHPDNLLKESQLGHILGHIVQNVHAS